MNWYLTNTHIDTPHHYNQSQHYSWCQWSILGIFCLRELNFSLAVTILRLCSGVRKGLAICFVWHLLQLLSFLSSVLQILAGGFLLSFHDCSPHFPLFWIPLCDKPFSYTLTVFLLVSEIHWMIKVFPLHCGGGKQKEASGYGTYFSLGYTLWTARAALHIISFFSYW